MKKVYFVISLIILASMVLSACGGQPEPVVEEPVMEEVVEEVEEEVLNHLFSSPGQTDAASKPFQLFSVLHAIF